MSNPAPRHERNGRFLDFEQAQLYFETVGSGPPVLLLHGGTGDVKDMDGLADRLKGSHTVITANLRCHGRSSAALGTISYPQFADDSLHVLDEVASGTVDVIGFSDGAITALLMAVIAPDRFGSVVAIGADIFPSGMRAEMREYLTKTSPEEFNRQNTAYVEGRKEDFADLSNWDEFLATMFSLWTTGLNMPPDRVKTVKARTLIVSGDRDEFISPRHSVEIYELIPKATLAILPGTTHWESAYRPDVWDNVIVPFLEKPEKKE